MCIFFCYRGLLLAVAWSVFKFLQLFRVLEETFSLFPLATFLLGSILFLFGVEWGAGGGLPPQALMTRRHCLYNNAVHVHVHASSLTSIGGP